MKRIPLWKMILLSIITLGFYEIYWFIVQRRSLAKKVGSKIPSPWWLIGSGIACLAAIIALIIVLLPSTQNTAVILWVSAASIFALSVAGVIRLWWVVVFLHAVEDTLKPRATFNWMLIHLLLVSVDVIFIAQYYFNRKADPKQKEPTRRFVALSIISFVVLFLGGTGAAVGLTISALQSPEVQNSLAENEELNKLGEKTTTLSKRYDGCVEQLDLSYPTVTDKNEKAYLKSYDACEKIRVEQNKAVDDYDALRKKVLNE